MTMQTKTIGRMPTDHGPYDPNLAYGKKFQCSLFGCAWESLHDNNNTAPAVWDGGDTITPNLVDWKKVSGDYNAWLMNNDKPAQSEQYPFNGMGRVKLLKHLVEVEEDNVTVTKNLLYQDDFYKDGPNNTRVPNTNTVFEVPYEFELAEDITIPDGCVLKFDGGSLSGAYTITGQNTTIKATSIGFLYENITLSGSFSNAELYVSWYKKEHDYNDSARINKLTNNPTSRGKTVVLDGAAFYITNSIQLLSDVSLKGLAGGTYLVALADNNIINLVNSNTHACCIEDIHFDFATGNKNGHGLYCNFMMSHLTIYKTRSTGVKVGYSSLYFDTYVPEGTDLGVNAINVYDCIFVGNGSGIVMLQGGDNCNIRDNNFSTNGGYCIYWDGIAGTASVNIENNAIVGGGKDCLFSISNVVTVTVRNNQCEASHPMVAGSGEDTTTALLKIGYASLRQPCANIDISHNNLNLNTSGTSTVASQNTILLKYVYGGIISNNCVSNSTNYVTLGTACYGIIIVKDLINTDSEHYPANIIDPALSAIVIDEESKTINLAGYCTKYNITTASTRKISGSIVPNVGGRPGEFASYNAAIGQNVDLNGYPLTKCGTSDYLTNSAVPTSLRYIGNLAKGFRFFDTTNNKSAFWGDWDSTNNKPIWLDYDGAHYGVKRSGTTADRPVGSSIYVGFMYFDTSSGINKPIYASAINGDTVTWVDATGTPV